MSKAAYKRILAIEESIKWEYPDDGTILPPSNMALEMALIEANLAVAQANVELAGELEAIRAQIASLR